MIDDLAKFGWTAVDITPGNCVQERWVKSCTGLAAELVRTKNGIKGVIKATEDLLEAKKRGELTLRELASLEEGAAVLEKLMRVLELDPPKQTADLPSRKKG